MFTFNHYNYNVLDLEKSMAFYAAALGLKEVRRKEAPDGSWKLVYLGDGKSDFTLELTWLRDRKEPYNLGENEFHLAFQAEDFDAAHAKHKEMGCICFENPEMGIYFINDPDNYWLEIIRTPNVKSPWNFSKGIQILFFLFLQLCQSFLNLCQHCFIFFFLCLFFFNHVRGCLCHKALICQLLHNTVNLFFQFGLFLFQTFNFLRKINQLCQRHVDGRILNHNRNRILANACLVRLHGYLACMRQ